MRDDRWARLAERAAWEETWLSAAGELAARATVAVGDMDSPGTIQGSLHKGEVGVAVLAADLSRPEAASMPFFGAPA